MELAHVRTGASIGAVPGAAPGDDAPVLLGALLFHMDGVVECPGEAIDEGIVRLWVG